MPRLPRMLFAVGVLSILPIVGSDAAAVEDPDPTAAVSPASVSPASADATEPNGDTVPEGPSTETRGPLAHLPAPEPGFEPNVVEQRILGYLDADGDGVLSPPEIAQFPTPMRRWLEVADVPRNQPIPTADFAPVLRRILDDLRKGQHSVAAARRAPGSVRAEPTAGASAGTGATGGTAAKPEVKVVISDEIATEAGYSFGRMDQNPRDGKLQLEEWSANYKKWFEDNGAKIPREMDKDTFVQNYAKFRRK